MTAAVDPAAIPKKMTREQLEWWILFGICVAGKGAKQTETKVKMLLNRLFYLYGKRTPFELVKVARNNGTLYDHLKVCKIGQYRRIFMAFRAAVDLDLDFISVPALEAIPGIGPKTARMIILYYDPKADCAVLDTHILKWLREKGIPKVPKSTPPAGPTYNRLEKAFQDLAKKARKSVRDLDTEVWKRYAKHS